MTARGAVALAFALAACTPAAAPTATAKAPAPPLVDEPRSGSAGPAVGSAAAFDRAGWLEDLDALVAAMSSHYANLDYSVRVRRLDLPRVLDRARTRLAAATTDDEAHRAFRKFVAAFGDAHVEIDWTPHAAAGAATAGTGESLCKRLGYAPHDTGGVDFAQVAPFVADGDADATDIPGGVVDLGAQRRLGVVRIAEFMEANHPALCELARIDLHLADDAACDDDCADRLERAVADRLTAALERRATALARAGVTAIAVDLTGNGGGTDWVEPAMRVMTPAHLQEVAIDVVRHPHWDQPLADNIRDLAAELARGDLPHGELAAAIAARRAALAEVRAPCDRSALWTTVTHDPACTQLARVTPVVGYASPGELAGRANAEAIFGASKFRYHEGTNRLPLAVIVDGGTASAAEDFAAELQDAHAAVIVGATTVGAGCGFTNGGIPTVLPHSGAWVHLPDCVRLRADGTNAVAGVTPDVVLPLLDRDSPYQRAVKVVAGLRDAWPRVAAGR